MLFCGKVQKTVQATWSAINSFALISTCMESSNKDQMLKSHVLTMLPCTASSKCPNKLTFSGIYNTEEEYKMFLCSYFL